MHLLCPVGVSLEQQHETKTHSLFAAECMLQLKLQQTTTSIVQLQAIQSH